MKSARLEVFGGNRERIREDPAVRDVPGIDKGSLGRIRAIALASWSVWRWRGWSSARLCFAFVAGFVEPHPQGQVVSVFLLFGIDFEREGREGREGGQD